MKSIITSLCLVCIIISHAQEAIHVKTIGEGQPVLMLPGFANSSDVWKETIENLEGEYQFHLIDYAGFDGVEPIEMPWLPQVTAAIKNYISTNNLENTIIIGHSLGGTIALYLAAELQNNIQQLVIVDALPNTAGLMFPNQEPRSFSYKNPYADMMLKMSETDFENSISQQIQMMTKNESKRNIIKQWMLNTDRETYVYGYVDYLNFDATPHLEKINCDVLLLAATSYGKSQSEQIYTEQYKELKNYNIQYAEDSAHYIMFDQPEWFYSQINDVLDNDKL